MKITSKISSSRRKQRKRHFAPNNYNRHHRMRSALSKELQAKYNIKTITPNKNDMVKIKSGVHKNKTGKVLKVSMREFKIYVDCCETIINNKRVAEGVHYSNLEIVSLDLSHASRLKAITKRKEANQRKKERFEKFYELTAQNLEAKYPINE